MQQVRDQVFDKKVESVSKACRKPARTCRKPGCKPGRKPGLQLARIMECCLYTTITGKWLGLQIYRHEAFEIDRQQYWHHDTKLVQSPYHFFSLYSVE